MGYGGNFRRMPPGQKALFFVGATFMLVYFFLGVIFLTVTNLPFMMSPTLKIGFGLLLIAYSIFRLVRLLGTLKDEQSEE